MSYPEALRGAGQVLKTFEKDITYYSTDNVVADDDGYVRGNVSEEYTLRAAVVPQQEKELNNLEYGDDLIGANEVYIRTEEQNINEEIEISIGDYFKIDGNEWKIISVDDYGTVIKCTCGLSSEEGYKIGGS